MVSSLDGVADGSKTLLHVILSKRESSFLLFVPWDFASAYGSRASSRATKIWCATIYMLDSWYMPCMFCTWEAVVTTFWLRCFDIWQEGSDSSFKSPPWGYLQEGMLFNHFQKNRELTTKVGLTNNLRRRSCGDLGKIGPWWRVESFEAWGL